MSEPLSEERRSVPWGNYLVNALWCTLFAYAMLGLLFTIPLQFEALNPLMRGLNDFKFTDVVYSQLKEDQPKEGASIVIKMGRPDTSIVVINIGDLPTVALAELVAKIAEGQPKVVGIDVIFNNPVRDSEADSALAEAFTKVPKLVLACNARYNYDINRFDSVDGPVPILSKSGSLGFVNLITENQSDDNSTGEQNFGNICRDFTPYLRIHQKDTLNSFAVEVAKAVWPNEARQAILRGEVSETINYSRTINQYYFIEGSQILTDPEFSFNYKDKVVLLGYLGRQLGDPTYFDKFFTPLNKQYVGRSLPDMFGVVIHANILSQIKERRYIDIVSDWYGLPLGFLIVYINVLGFYYINKELPAWYDLLTKTIQFFESLLLIFLVVHLYDLLALHLDLTVAIGALLLCGDLLEVYTGALPLINKFVIEKFANFITKIGLRSPDVN